MIAPVRRIGLMRPIALLLALAGVAAAGDVRAVPTALRAAKDRSPAPAFALTDANGAPITLSRYKGRVVLLDFWATWCTGCKVEIPWYMEFQKKYAKQGLASIGVAMDEEGWEKVRPYLQVHPINYPIVLGVPDLEKPYQIESLPVTLLIDRHGRIADAHVGMVVKDTWEKEIRQLLKE
jgi:peroxiredoxin